MSARRCAGVGRLLVKPCPSPRGCRLWRLGSYVALRRLRPCALSRLRALCRAPPCAAPRGSGELLSMLLLLLLFNLLETSNNVKSRSVLCHFCHVWCFALPASPLLCPPGAARSRGNARLAAPVRLFFLTASAYIIRGVLFVFCSCLRCVVFLSSLPRALGRAPFAGKCSLGRAPAPFCPCTGCKY